MIWSITKIFLFIFIITLTTFGLGLLHDSTGTITIKFSNWEISLGSLHVAIAMLLGFFAVWLMIWILGGFISIFHFFNGDETAISRYFLRNREERGYKALTDSLVALAANENKKALAKAAVAEKNLNRPQLTNLLNAQTAEKAGNSEKAQRYYKRMINDEQTRFAGLQGLLRQKLHQNEIQTAILLAQKAVELRPQHAKTLHTLFDLQIKQSQWRDAIKTLDLQTKATILPRDVAKRRKAILTYCTAKERIEAGSEAGDVDLGTTQAISANKLSSDFIPAAVLACKIHTQNDAKHYATKIIKKAWSTQPHPELARAFAEIMPNETPQQRLKRFQPLIKSNAHNIESILLQAELYLANEDFPSARRIMGNIAQETPTMRALTIMAAIEKGEGATEASVRALLNRAMNASIGAQWVCSNCSNIHSDWQATCKNCQTFDSLSWEIPHLIYNNDTTFALDISPTTLLNDMTAETDNHYNDDMEDFIIEPPTEDPISN